MAAIGASAVTGLGHAVPAAVVTNTDLERRLDTDDEWITARTGISERRWVDSTESTVSLAVEAGGKALAAAGRVPADVRLLVLATCTPVRQLPGDAASVQSELGLGGGAFDLNAACSGFVYGLVSAGALTTTLDGPVLVIGTETLSRIVDPDDRATAVLFGDGAGAAVIEPDATGAGLLGLDLGTDGTGARHLQIPPGEDFLRMDGGEVFRFAVRTLVDSGRNALRDAGMEPADVDLFVPHQANARIIDAATQRLGIPMDRTMVNVHRHGNTSAASIPIALSEAAQQGRLRSGDIVLLSGFGAGLSWASALLRWGR
jgi:3-oxoacyl-[acyl-carrier-protein] synthase-3